MENKYQDTPLSYGLNVYGSNNPFDFHRAIRLNPWIKNFSDSKDYLKSLVEHWVLLYTWRSVELGTKKQRQISYVAGQLFVAMFAGQYVLAVNKNLATMAKYEDSGVTKAVKKYYEHKKDHPVFDAVDWSPQHIGIRSVALLFVMQMMLHNNLDQFFMDVTDAYKTTSAASNWYHYMNELLKQVKNSGYNMKWVYSRLNSMLRTCFKRETEF